MSVRTFEFRRVGKAYGPHVALDDLSFSLCTRTHAALLGPSGCGKSTALRILAGLEAPDSGEVLLDGTVVSDRRGVHVAPHRRHLRMVFQDLALWPNLNARENVALGLSGLRLSRREARARAEGALDLCGVRNLADRKPGELSGGQQQRVALARAVAPTPEFLLLDEPFAALDLVSKAALVEELRRLARDQRVTLVVVSHDPFDAVSLCEEAVVLERGALVEAGPLTQLIAEPRSELLRLFRDRLSPLAEAPSGEVPSPFVPGALPRRG